MYARNVSADIAPVPKALVIAVCLLQSEVSRRWLGRVFHRGRPREAPRAPHPAGGHGAVMLGLYLLGALSYDNYSPRVIINLFGDNAFLGVAAVKRRS
ncbi:MAG: hypothetical protein U1G05_18220 [Kiritimatiellia bacterium]